MKRCFKYIKKLECTSSTNEKQRLLKHFLRYTPFKTLVILALSKDLKFKINKFPNYTKYKQTEFGFISKKPDTTTSNIFKTLFKYSKLTGVKQEQKDYLFSLLDTKEKYEVVKRICTKDLKCGVNAKLVNNTRKGTVNIVPYMRCSTIDKISNIQFPAILQEKADGMFVNVMINKYGSIKIVTRNGKIVHCLEHLKQAILKGYNKKPQKHKKGVAPKYYGIKRNKLSRDLTYNTVYTGELLVIRRGKLASREFGNGVLNSCIHGTTSRRVSKLVVLRIWDCLPFDAFKDGEHTELYKTRLFRCSQFVNYVNDKHYVDLVPTVTVSTEQEVKSTVDKWIKEGKEGGVLKDFRLIWKYHTSTLAIKIINKIDVELRPISLKSGKKGTKYENCLGSIQFESECGKIQVFASSGLTDKQRGFKKVAKSHKHAIKSGIYYIDALFAKNALQYWSDVVKKRTVCRLECKSIIQDKRDTEIYSLYQPRNIVVRLDKDRADTLEEVLER